MALGKVKELVSSNPVVIFSNKLCPYCVCVKQLFVLKLGVQYKAIELDQESDGSEIQSALAEWTGQHTLPNVFVGGYHIGDCDSCMMKMKGLWYIHRESIFGCTTTGCARLNVHLGDNIRCLSVDGKNHEDLGIYSNTEEKSRHSLYNKSLHIK